MRLFGASLLWLFAAIGVIACVVGAGFFLIGPGDPLDRTRVLAVIPAASGRKAAVAYLHHVANYSTDVLVVKLARPPFPVIGSEIRPAEEIIVIAHPLVSGWSSNTNSKTLDEAKQLIGIAWNGTSADVIDVCPKDGARLVKFNAEHSGSDEYVTLCRKSEQ